MVLRAVGSGLILHAGLRLLHINQLRVPSEARAAASEDGDEAREADAVAEAGQDKNQSDDRKNDRSHFLEALVGAVYFEIITADAADLDRARAELANRLR